MPVDPHAPVFKIAVMLDGRISVDGSPGHDGLSSRLTEAAS